MNSIELPSGGGNLQSVLTAGNTTGTNWIEANDGFGIKNTGTNDIRVQLNSTTGLLRLENNSAIGDTSGLDITPSTISITTVNSFTVNGGSGGPFEGIKYAADYSSLYTNRSLVDKEYADGIISSSSNSLYQTLLNGNQTGPNWIDVDNLFGLRLSDFNALKQVQLRTGDIKLFIDDSTYQSTVLIEPAQITLDSGNQFLLRARDLAEIEGYGTNFPGLTYISDHSADYTPRSLVDKAYVDSVAGGGILGISDATGAYTYYSTLSAAMTAATSGDTIELFADIEETTSTTITLKDGVKINGNGHTYTLSVNDATNAFTYSAVGTIELFNLKVLRTGRTAGTGTGYCLFFDNSSAIIRCNGVTFENDFGSACRGRGKIYGAKAFAYITAFVDSSGSCSVYDCYGESTGTGVGIACNGYISNSTGVAVSSTGILATNGTVVNCVGISTSGYGIYANASNSVGISNSSSGLHTGNYKSCTAISVSGYGAYRATLTNCTILSTSGVASYESSIYNCYVQTNANVATWIRDNTEIKNCNIVNNYNAVTGHGTGSAVVRTGIKIHNTTIKVANASAYCISSYPNCTVSYVNNSFQGSTTPVSSNVIQTTTNTSDSQGNILS